MSHECCRDRLEIIDVLNAYARTLDSRSWVDLEQVFDENIVGDYGIDRVVGRLNLINHIRTFLDDCGPSQHLLSNYEIDINGDVATSRCKIRVIHVGKGTRAALRPFESMGTYRDELRRTPNGWRITWRINQPGINIGDLRILQPQ